MCLWPFDKIILLLLRASKSCVFGMTADSQWDTTILFPNITNFPKNTKHYLSSARRNPPEFNLWTKNWCPLSSTSGWINSQSSEDTQAGWTSKNARKSTRRCANKYCRDCGDCGDSGDCGARFYKSTAAGAMAGGPIVDCPTRWSLWYWYWDFYVDHLVGGRGPI